MMDGEMSGSCIWHPMLLRKCEDERYDDALMLWLMGRVMLSFCRDCRDCRD